MYMKESHVKLLVYIFLQMQCAKNFTHFFNKRN